jgi:hypothetical protein
MAMLGTFSLLIFAFAVLLSSGCGNSKSESEAGASASKRPLQSKNNRDQDAKTHEELTELFKNYLLNAVKNDLKDPDSARFRNVVYYGSYIKFKDGKRVRLGTHTICGEVNAKNSFGGYGGYREFRASVSRNSETKVIGDVASAVSSEEPGMARDIFVKSRDAICKEIEIEGN